MTGAGETTQMRWRRAPLTQLEALVSDRPILILAPHPDDETIGCGGLISQARGANIPVAIDFLTDGSRSHTGSIAFDRTRLAALRQQEAIQAAGRLGVDRACIRFWPEEDSMLASGGAHADDLVATLRTRIAETGAGTVFVTWIDDPHCDHKAAFGLAMQSLESLAAPPRLYAYPVWSWTIDTAQSRHEGHVVRLDVSDEIETKREALACHASQLGQVIKDDPGGFCLSPENLAHFVQPYETFISVIRHQA